MKDIAIMYHYVRVPEWKGIYPLHPELFKAQLEWLLKNFELVSPEELGKPKGLKPRCVITFDDATKDQYEIAFPILQSKGIPAYFTLISGVFEQNKVPIVHLTHTALSYFSDEEIWEELKRKFDMSTVHESSVIYTYEKDIYRRYNKYALNFLLTESESRSVLEPKVIEVYRSWDNFINSFYINLDEWRTMLHAGITIGVHGVEHKPYCGDTKRFFEDEVMPCKQFIIENLGVQPQWYTPAFGGGVYYQEMMEQLPPILEVEGFIGGFTTIPQYNEGKSSFWLNRFDCNRIPPVGNFN